MQGVVMKSMVYSVSLFRTQKARLYVISSLGSQAVGGEPRFRYAGGSFLCGKSTGVRVKEAARSRAASDDYS